MASIQFQIHADKENASGAGLAGLKMPSGNAHAGKTFQSSHLQSLKTPRRALGSVNEAHRVGGRPLENRIWKNSGGGDGLAPDRKPTKDPKARQSNQFKDKENDVVQKKKQQQGEKNKSSFLSQNKQSVGVIHSQQTYPDIEYMPPPSPTKDDDEDILPMKERASTYVSKIFSWRPMCLYGVLPDSDDEEDERLERQQIMDQLDSLPMPASDFSSAIPEILPEAVDLSGLELPSLDDLDIPDICCCDTEAKDTSTSVNSMSELDDSVGLVPHLGSLEMLDESLSPSTPSK